MAPVVLATMALAGAHMTVQVALLIQVLEGHVMLVPVVSSMTALVALLMTAQVVQGIQALAEKLMMALVALRILVLVALVMTALAALVIQALAGRVRNVLAFVDNNLSARIIGTVPLGSFILCVAVNEPDELSGFAATFRALMENRA